MDNNEQFDIDLEQLLQQEWCQTSDEQLLEELSAVESELNREKGGQKSRVTWQQNLLLYLHDFVYLVAILVILSPMFIRMVVVDGTSMNRTLLDGDYLFVLSNTFYREPQNGDIVVVSKESFDNGAPIVKRVIATEGQMVDIDFNLGIVYVDGVALDEPYTNSATTLDEGVDFPLLVQEGCIFVLGDNRDRSRDSRYPGIGQIAVEEVLGKVIFLFLPGTNGTDSRGNPYEPRDWTRIGVIG